MALLAQSHCRECLYLPGKQCCRIFGHCEWIWEQQLACIRWCAQLAEHDCSSPGKLQWGHRVVREWCCQDSLTTLVKTLAKTWAMEIQLPTPSETTQGLISVTFPRISRTGKLYKLHASRMQLCSAAWRNVWKLVTLSSCRLYWAEPQPLISQSSQVCLRATWPSHVLAV